MKLAAGGREPGAARRRRVDSPAAARRARLSDPQTAILVLGMHRSGTSSFAGLAARLGASLGDDLLDANEWNPRGYGEHRGVVAIHDRLLAAQALAWDSPRAPRLDGAPADDARAALRELLAREFVGAPLFAVKDPRLCRLLPLWRDALRALGARPAHVLVLRHPLEVADSLARRDGTSRSRSHLLFLQHVLAAERETRGAPRSLVLFDELFADWRAVAKRVAAECAFAWPRDLEAAAPEVEAFLSRDLRHHRAPPDWPEEEAVRFPWLWDAWENLAALAAGAAAGERAAALDGVSERLAAAAALYQPELAAMEARADLLDAQRREAEKRAQKAERRRDRLADSPWLWLRTFARRRLRRERE
jgi:hypothetical protein